MTVSSGMFVFVAILAVVAVAIAAVSMADWVKMKITLKASMSMAENLGVELADVSEKLRLVRSVNAHLEHSNLIAEKRLKQYEKGSVQKYLQDKILLLGCHPDFELVPESIRKEIHRLIVIQDESDIPAEEIDHSAAVKKLQELGVKL